MKKEILTELNVAQLTGPKGLVVFFYPMAKTSGCAIEVAVYNKKLKEFKELGFNVVGISKDDTALNGEFASECDLDYPLISDIDLKYLNKFGVIGEKEVDGKKQSAVIRSTFAINSKGEILIEMRNVDFSDHIDTLLAKLKHL